MALEIGKWLSAPRAESKGLVLGIKIVSVENNGDTVIEVLDQGMEHKKYKRVYPAKKVYDDLLHNGFFTEGYDD